jgi:hypothetical protein
MFFLNYVYLAQNAKSIAKKGNQNKITSGELVQITGKLRKNIHVGPNLQYNLTLFFFLSITGWFTCKHEWLHQGPVHMRSQVPFTLPSLNMEAKSQLLRLKTTI